MSRSLAPSTTAALSPKASASIQKGQQTTASGLTASQVVLPAAPSKSSTPLITDALKQSADQASCMNYSTFMGAHNVGQSLKIQKFKDAVSRQSDEVRKQERIYDRRLATLESLVSRGAGARSVDAARKKASESRIAVRAAKDKLAIYAGALASCVATGYSDPSKAPGSRSQPESPHTRTQSVPRQDDEQEMFATPDAPVVEEALVLIEEEKPWYTNPLVIGLGVLAAGGAYVFVRRQQ